MSRDDELNALNQNFQLLEADSESGQKQAANDAKAVTQVAFKAMQGASLNTIAQATIDIPFSTKLWDLGTPNHDSFNPITGYFTAPVRGVYHFTTVAMTESVTTTRSFFTSRGSATLGRPPGITTGPNRIAERPFDQDTSWNRRTHASYEIYMEKGETFGMSLWTSAAGNIGGNPETWFAGHLVYRGDD